MKAPRLVLALLALTFVLAPQSPRTAFAQRTERQLQGQTDFAKSGRGFSDWPSCEDSMDGGLSRRGPYDV